MEKLPSYNDVHDWDFDLLTPFEKENIHSQYILEDVYGQGKIEVLRNTLTQGECKNLIEQIRTLPMMKIGEEGGKQQDIRRVKRCLVENSKLCVTLYERLKRFFPEIELTKQNHQRVGQVLPNELGKWRPVCLNSRFRVCSYEQSGHFAPHFDGVYKDKKTGRRSMMTVMWYLNGPPDFEGGTTNFVKEGQKLWKSEEDGVYRAQEENILFKLVPEGGMVLLFQAQILHEGEQLKTGEKHILRTEVMYERYEAYDNDLSDNQKKALEFYQEACDIEQTDAMKAALLFEKAFKLDPELEKRMME